jgi:glyoxylase-like metal-dependent hydrolase (beta-lactamase superfamily II)
MNFGARNPSPFTGDGNNTFLLDGAEPTLVDAGIGVPAHIDAIAAALGGRALARVLVTHGHPDHASGAPALRIRWPHLELHKWPLATDASDVEWRSLADGDRVRAGDRLFEVVYTPGHAPDHVCFWDADAGDLYGGDMLVEGSTVMIPSSRGGNLRAYLESLDRLEALRPGRVLPGHGPLIERPLDLIHKYREHRRVREQQILGCLGEGLTTTDAILERIYPDLAPALIGAARDTVLAHLVKLRDEGLAS